MNDWEPIFEGTPESARSLAVRLEQAGLHSFVESREPYSRENGESLSLAAVLVPPPEKQRASEVALEWRALQPERVAQLTARFSRILGLSLLPPALWLAASLLAPGSVPAPGFGWLALLFSASLIIFGRLENRRFQSERVGPPAA